MSDLTDFLLARVSEDEADARKAQEDLVRAPDGLSVRPIGTDPLALAAFDSQSDLSWRYRAERVLAECKAKRQIVEDALLWSSPQTVGPSRGHARTDDYAKGVQYAAEIALYQLAQPYADHPDFQAEWRLL